ncbi:DUF4240 domain-containing protein [Myceligenerans halotolerans]
MDVDTFRRLVAEIRKHGAAPNARDGEALANKVVDTLAERLGPDELLAFEAVAGALADTADSPAMEAAMFLIEGYISDDTFMDLRDGLILLGRETFEAAVADPDSLAEYFENEHLDSSTGRMGIAFESITSCVADAWVRVTGAEDRDVFWDAAESFERQAVVPVSPPADEPSILHDADATRARLPRLAERFPHRFKPRAAAPLLAPAEGEPSERASLSEYQKGLSDGRADATSSRLSNKRLVPDWGRLFWEEHGAG